MAAGNIVKENKIPTIGTSCTNHRLLLTTNITSVRASLIRSKEQLWLTMLTKMVLEKEVAIIQEVSNDYAVGLAKFFKEAFIKLTEILTA